MPPDDINNLLLRVEGEDAGAEDLLDDLGRGLNELDSRRVEAEARIDGDQAERELLRLQERLANFSRQVATAEGDVDISPGMEALSEMIVVLEAVDLSEAKPEVTARVARALADLTLVQAFVEELDASDVEIDVDVSRGLAERMAAASGQAGKLASTLGSLGESAADAGGGMGNVGVRIGQFSAGLGPVVAGVLLLAAAIVGALVAGLTALVASLGAAILALGAFTAALVAALGPIAVLGIAVAARIGKIAEAFQAQDKASDAAAKSAITGASATLAAAKAVEAAERRVADAEDAVQVAAEQVGTAFVEAHRAMEDAAENVRDAVLDIQDAELGMDEAALQTKEAELALRQFADAAGVSFDQIRKFTDVDFQFDRGALAKIFEGGDPQAQLQLEQLILNVRRAKLGEKQATDQLSDAELTLKRAREENLRFLQMGIRAHGPYVAALRAQDQAAKNLADAEHQLADAHDQAAQAVSSQAAAAAVAVNKLSGEEQTLLRVARQMRNVWREVFTPATNIIILAIANGLRSLMPMLRALRPAIMVLGRAVGQSIGLFFQMIKAMGPQFAILFRAAARVAPLMTRMFILLLRILLNIGQAAMPFLIAGLRALNRFLGGIAKSTGDVAGTRSGIAVLVGHFLSWFNLIVQVARVIGALFSAAMPSGKGFVDVLASGAKALADWMSSAGGKNTLRTFFNDVIPLAKQLIKFFFLLFVLWMQSVQALAPALTLLFKGFNLFLGILIKIVEALMPVIQVIAIIAAAVGGLIAYFLSGVGPITTAILIIISVFTLLGIVATHIGGAVVAAFNFMARVVTAVWRALRSAASSVWNAIKRVITSGVRRTVAIVTGIWDGASGVIKAIWNAIKTAAKAVWTAIRTAVVTPIRLAVGLVKGFFERLARGLKVIWDAIKSVASRVWERIKAIVTGAIQKTLDFFKGLATKFKDAGVALIKALVRGIKSVASLPVDAVKKVAGKVLDVLPFSEPKDTSSPLRGLGKSGEALVANIASGIEKQASAIPNALASSLIRTNLHAAIAQPAALAGGPQARTNVERQIFNLPPAPGAAVPDAEYQASQLALALARKGF